MRVDYDPSTSFIVLHEGAGFDSSDPGRATVTIGGLQLSAVRNGTDFNGYQLRILANKVVSLFDPTGVQVAQGVASAATYTAVAALINGTQAFNGVLRASLTTPGAIAPLTATLVGGVDPTLEGMSTRFHYVAAANGGLFYFDQQTNVIVTQIEGKFPGGAGTGLSVEFVNLDDGYRVVASETATIFVSVLPATEDFAITDVHAQLNRHRAIRVTCPFAGKVWVSVRVESPQSRL